MNQLQRLSEWIWEGSGLIFAMSLTAVLIVLAIYAVIDFNRRCR